MAEGGLLEVKVEGLEALVRALMAEADGKTLRKELARNLRAALKPTVSRAKSEAMTIPGGSRTHAAPRMRQQIARRIVADVRLSGRITGARIRARKTTGMRDFVNAPKRTQGRKGWEHPTFGDKGAMVVQRGRLEWFDKTTKASEPEARAACLHALEDMARRIAMRAGS